MNVTTTNPDICRLLSGKDIVKSEELYKQNADGHKFSVGETRILTGLESYPEFNGELVEITAIRKDGDNGKAYYVKGRINQFINWVYEYRLA
jgi:hypothetical protein